MSVERATEKEDVWHPLVRGGVHMKDVKKNIFTRLFIYDIYRKKCISYRRTFMGKHETNKINCNTGTFLVKYTHILK